MAGFIYKRNGKNRRGRESKGGEYRSGKTGEYTTVLKLIGTQISVSVCVGAVELKLLHVILMARAMLVLM